MKKISRTIALTALMAALAGTASLGVSAASAHDETGSTLVDRLATRFNLNRDEVQQVVDEVRTERHQAHEARYAERLEQAVADGVLTTEQKDQLIAKHDELRAFVESLKATTPEERRAALKTKHEELRVWADQHDIPVRYLLGAGLRGHHPGPKQP